jgi:Zn-finger nucleic acid-binding protein
MMFEAISRTLPLGSVGFEQTRSPSGEVYIWLDPREADKLMAERRQGEGYSEPSRTPSDADQPV